MKDSTMSAFIDFLATQKDFYLPAKVTRDTGQGYFSVRIPLRLPVSDSTDILVTEFSIKTNNTLSVDEYVKIKLREVPCRRDKRNDGQTYHLRPKATLEGTINKAEYDKQKTKLNNICEAFDQPNGENIKIFKELFSEANNWFSFSKEFFYLQSEKFNSILNKLVETTQASANALEQAKQAIQETQTEKEMATHQKEEFEQKIANLEPREQTLNQQEADLKSREQSVSHKITVLKQLGLYSPPKDETPAQAADPLNGQNFQKALSYPQSPLIEKSFQLALVSSLVRGRLILLEGSVGVGKTHLAENFAQQLGGSSKTIPVRPSWIDSSDLFGFFDPLARIFRPADFTEAICEFPKDRVYPIVLDEMNLGRIENYGADLLSRIEKIVENRLEEKDKQLLQIWSATECASLKEELVAITSLPDSAQKPEYIQRKNQLQSLLKKYTASMPLPDGFILMGTLNADESTFEISPKVIDRSYVLSFPNLSKENFNNKNDLKDKFIFSPQLLRKEFSQYLSTTKVSFWDSLSQIISDEEMATIGIPYSHRLLTDFGDLFIFCCIMKVDNDEYIESFIWSRILPRVSFFKSSDEKIRQKQKNALDKLIKQIPKATSITKHLSQQMEDDNRNLVKFFGR